MNDALPSIEVDSETPSTVHIDGELVEQQPRRPNCR